MAKQLKLVINSKNEQVNYDSNGKESGSNTSASYIELSRLEVTIRKTDF